MNSVLITGGDLPLYRLVKDYLDADYICVADSGLDWVLENKIEFDYLVGDMDSLSNIDLLNNIDNDKIYKLPTDKDDTDTLFGLKHLKEIGSNNITLIGGGGGRLDHLLGIFSLFTTDIAPDIWITAKEIVYCTKGKFPLDKFLGSSISVYPVNEVNCVITSYGLKWELNSVDWKYKSIGISNQVVISSGWIDSGTNKILIIIPIEGRRFE
ncbi:MAG: thiamine diphosphokinase [Spirochaetales bacterium]|nr:thiamine diphosphokinase [Spirochaetales bacterium]